MKNKFFLGAFVCLTLCLLVFNWLGNRSHVVISIKDSEILSSNIYYMKYISKFLLANNEPTIIEEAVKESFSAERYIMNGQTLLTVEDGKSAKVYYNNELIEQLEINSFAPSVVTRFDNLKYANISGNITIEGILLSFEEYVYASHNNATNSIRFLYKQNNLWGLQYPASGQYVKILELSMNIPKDFDKYFSSYF